MLEKTPYINVDIRQRKEDIIVGLDKVFGLELVELGAFYCNPGEQDRCFSPEWFLNSRGDRTGTLQLEYDQKMVRIVVCSDFRLSLTLSSDEFQARGPC